jgi:hypothetical protein
MANITTEYSTRPLGQPEGYDYYVPVDEETSRLLERSDRDVRVGAETLGVMVVDCVDTATSTYQSYYKELLEDVRTYNKRKADVSANIVIPFINSLHGEDSHITVSWSHNFRSPYIAVKYQNDVEDHAVEKDAYVGTFTTDEVGISDAMIEALESHDVEIVARKEIRAFILRNYPDLDGRNFTFVHAFTKALNTLEEEYEGLRNEAEKIIYNYVSSKYSITEFNWTIDFGAKIVQIDTPINN